MKFGLKEALRFRFVWLFISSELKRRLAQTSKRSLKQIKHKAFSDYRAIVVRWPYNGGKSNLMGKNADFAMPFIAIYRASGLSPEAFREALHNAFNKPYFVRLTSSKSFDLKAYYEKLSRGADWSQAHKSEFSKTFVYTISHSRVEEKPIAVGWDFSRCEICELFQSEGVAEIIPAFCELDYVIVERRAGAKLKRDHTIAEGADSCDFFVYFDDEACKYKYEDPGHQF